jgi:hypothetical protein
MAAEDRRDTRAGDEGGVGDGKHTLHLLRALAMLRSHPRCRTGASFERRIVKLATGGEVIAVARVTGSGCRRCCARGWWCMPC